MASQWRVELVGNVATNLDSRRIPLSSREREERRGPYPYYGATGILDYVDDYLFEGLHVLIAEDGSVEREDGTPFVQLVDGKFWVNNHAHVLRAKSINDTRFLYYALSSVRIRPFMSGSVQAKLTQENLNRVPIHWPPGPERRAIAHILGTLDDKIELNRRMSETLEQMARALFKAWFVDFEPVRAKMEGRWRRGQSLPGLPAHLYDLFPARLVDSELGEIPEGWRVGTISDCCIRIQNGGTPSRNNPYFWVEGNIPWLTSAEVRQPIVTATEHYITDAGMRASSAKWIDQLSTVIALYGATAGQVSLVALRLTTNQAVCALIPKPGFEFYNFFWMRKSVPDLEAKAVGSAQQNISKAIVEETCVLLPPEAVVKEFSKTVAPIVHRWILATAESRTLAALRDALLPKLISGELRVKDAERFLKERGL
jgi:type I restriction enzyme S subunit